MLTKKQQLFVNEFCSNPTMGKTEAARAAGFSKSRAAITACELMKNPEVQNEIKRRLEKRIDLADVNPETVIEELLSVIEACKQAGAGAWQMTARLKAIELLGKHLRMFSERVEVGVDGELMERLMEGRRRAGVLRPEELKAEMVRAQLPAAKVIEVEEESVN